MFCNKPFKAFLEGQIMSRDKLNPLLARKTYSFDVAVCHQFYKYSSIYEQHLFYAIVTKSY